ncbi:MAG: CoA transferase [Candidatus Hydrogenedentes bacterium]|nr:CoA transferase [Candidatus Hydrogenedentota bacterium]
MLWENLHRGKRLVSLEKISLDLWQFADVIITDRPLHQLGVHSTQDAIVVQITPYGLTGLHRNRPATELTIEATSGFLSLNGCADKAPLRAPGNLIGYYCGVYAFVGALNDTFLALIPIHSTASLVYRATKRAQISRDPQICS